EGGGETRAGRRRAVRGRRATATPPTSTPRVRTTAHPPSVASARTPATGRDRPATRSPSLLDSRRSLARAHGADHVEQGGGFQRRALRIEHLTVKRDRQVEAIS